MFYGTISFSGAWAMAGGTTGPITAFTNFGINLIPTASGGGTDYTSSVVNSNSPGLWESSGASSSFTITFGSANSTASQSGITQSSAIVVASTCQATGTQPFAAPNRVSSALNVDFAAADRILGAIDEFDIFLQAGNWDRIGGRPSKDPVQSLALDLSLAGDLDGYFPYSSL